MPSVYLKEPVDARVEERGPHTGRMNFRYADP